MTMIMSASKALPALAIVKAIADKRTPMAKTYVAFSTDLPPGFIAEGKVHLAAGTGPAPSKPLLQGSQLLCFPAVPKA